MAPSGTGKTKAKDKRTGKELSPNVAVRSYDLLESILQTKHIAGALADIIEDLKTKEIVDKRVLDQARLREPAMHHSMPEAESMP